MKYKYETGDRVIWVKPMDSECFPGLKGTVKRKRDWNGQPLYYVKWDEYRPTVGDHWNMFEYCIAPVEKPDLEYENLLI